MRGVSVFHGVGFGCLPHGTERRRASPQTDVTPTGVTSTGHFTDDVDKTTPYTRNRFLV